MLRVATRLFAAGPGVRAGRPLWHQDLMKVALATLLVLVFQASGGFSALHNLQGDNDSLLRLVQLRDLIGGQGWFDMHQYRMGPEGGFPMHWSRVVDAPIAAMMISVGWLSGSQAFGETVAAIAWPLLTFAAALFFLLDASRRYARRDAAFPAVVIGGVSIYMLGLFLPAAFDHHNLQVALTMCMIAALLAAPAKRYAAPIAGATAALMMAIGAETVPYVAAGGLAAALLFLVRGEEERDTAVGFGAAFAVVSALAFVGTVPPSTWFTATCDAYSIAQFAIAFVGGCGLALIASNPLLGRTGGQRAAALGLLGLGTALLVLAAFPQCLADPYAGLDPRLRTYWLSAVTEAQSLYSILTKDPVMAASYYATPLLAVGLVGYEIRRRGLSRERALIGLFLGVAILVSLWQVRGAMFSISIAVIPLAAWVAAWRIRAQVAKPAAMAAVKLCLVWILSFSLAWDLAAGGVASAFGSAPKPTDSAAACYAEMDYGALAAMPTQTVLAVSNLGTPILKTTGHRVLAGPYHRNVAGNLLVQEALFAEPAKARDLLRQSGVTLVAHCPDNPETRLFTKWAPEGLMAHLVGGDLPDWLEPVAASPSGPLLIYRIREIRRIK